MSDNEIVPGPENNWGNPPTKEMLANHTLASRTMENHNTPRAIFDASELSLLREFVGDPSTSNIQRLLRDREMLDPEGVAGKDIGSGAAAKGSLAGYVVARYAKFPDGDHTFYQSEVDALREWFANGGGQ